MKFALSGYYGCGNTGDEAVLAGIKEAFAKQTGDTAKLLVLSQNPAATTQMHGLPAIERMNLSAVRRALRECDLLLSGGGSLLQDTTSMRSLLYYLWIARIAFSVGTPVMFYAQGMGPLHRALSRRLVRMVANRATAITVRDEPSARLLTSIGVTQTPIEVTADPAFALSPAAPEAIDALYAAEGLPTDTPLIGVALRPWGGAGSSPLDSYARLLTELEAQCGARAVLLPMETPRDVDFAGQVASRVSGSRETLVVQNVYPPSVLLGLVGRLQAVVAMRLHTLIFAAHMGVPPFALSYDPKVENLMKLLQREKDIEHWRGFNPSDVARRVAALLADRDANATHLRTLNLNLEQQALRNADCALAIVNRPSRLLK